MSKARNLASMLQDQQDLSSSHFQQTFGNKQALIQTPKLDHSQNHPREQQTRIRLLASFQQSYLDNEREPTLQPFYENPSSRLRSNEDRSEEQDRQLKQKRFLQKEYNSEGLSKQLTSILPVEKHQNPQRKQSRGPIQILQDKVESLRVQIQDQLFNIKLEDEIYAFLANKMSKGIKQIKDGKELKKNKTEKYYQNVYESAIEFMDQSDEFVNQYRKLRKMLCTDQFI